MYFADTAFDLEAYSVFTEYIVCTNLKSVQTYIIHTHTHTHRWMILYRDGSFITLKAMALWWRDWASLAPSRYGWGSTSLDFECFCVATCNVS